MKIAKVLITGVLAITIERGAFAAFEQRAIIQDLPREIKNENRDTSGNTALLVAVKNQNITMVQMLINEKVDLNEQDISPILCLSNEYEIKVEPGYKGNTALIIAASRGYTEIVDLLIKAKANLNIRGQYGCTALMEASAKGHKYIVNFLISGEADLNLQNEYGYTALMEAAVRGHKQVVELLIKAKADLNKQDRSGYTALMRASIKGDKDIVQLLVNAEADLSKQDQYGNTALTLAIQWKHKEIVDMFDILENTGAKE